MTLTMPRRLVRSGLMVVALLALAAAMLPLLAAGLVGGRVLVPAVLAVGLVSLAFPGVRRWLLGDTREAEDTLHNGLFLPAGVRLHAAHTWARRGAGGEVAVGVDDLMQRALGPATRVQVPAAGTRVVRGQPLFHLAHGDRSLAVRSPVTGTVAEVNEVLRVQPDLLNSEPYGDGWVVRMDADNCEEDARHLVAGRRAVSFFRHEVDRFMKSLSPQPAMATLQDGGVLVDDLHRRIDDVTWKRLKSEFFEVEG